MRNITKESIQAFNNGENFRKQNTEVIADGSRTTLKLHGNTIAIRLGGKLSITNAGWESNVTKERLNAIDGVSIQQKNFIWYLNGEEWDGELIEIR